MNVFRPAGIVMLLGCLPLFGACSSGQSTSGTESNSVTGAIASAMDKAKVKLQSEPITISHDAPGQPRAEITPSGDLVIDGKTVAITPEQRTALLAYREQTIAVATQGIEVGKQGIALGMHAAGAAIKGALSGQSDEEIQKKVEAQASDIRQAAAKICDRLPAMMAEQQKLAAMLPAFKPYATMTQKDIDDCRVDALHDDDSDRAQIQQSIRDRIRSGIQDAAQGAGLASSGTPSSGTAPQPASTTRR